KCTPITNKFSPLYSKWAMRALRELRKQLLFGQMRPGLWLKATLPSSTSNSVSVRAPASPRSLNINPVSADKE
ncbi:MAG TPA: hypothetical protein PLW19_05300, partial [Anaerolineaceae bacterium]|nr:hypothetical protein [Anaerolineaceae bacterium]